MARWLRRKMVEDGSRSAAKCAGGARAAVDWTGESGVVSSGPPTAESKPSSPSSEHSTGPGMTSSLWSSCLNDMAIGWLGVRSGVEQRGGGGGLASELNRLGPVTGPGSPASHQLSPNTNTKSEISRPRVTPSPGMVFVASSSSQRAAFDGKRSAGGFEGPGRSTAAAQWMPRYRNACPGVYSTGEQKTPNLLELGARAVVLLGLGRCMLCALRMLSRGPSRRRFNVVANSTATRS